MINSLLLFDQQISSLIVSLIPHNTFFDFIFAFLSLKGFSLPIWIVIVAVLLFIEEHRDKKKHIIIFFVITFVATALLVSYGFKNIFQRQRPALNNTYSQLACPTDFSFPSGHAATAFASATVLSAFDRKRRGFYYLVAGLIGLSRIYLQCHFFLDVVVGGLIGTLIARIVLITKDYFFLPRRTLRGRP